MLVTRRTLFQAAACLFAAPAIVRSSSLMPVKFYAPEWFAGGGMAKINTMVDGGKLTVELVRILEDGVLPPDRSAFSPIMTELWQRGESTIWRETHTFYSEKQAAPYLEGMRQHLGFRVDTTRLREGERFVDHYPSLRGLASRFVPMAGKS